MSLHPYSYARMCVSRSKLISPAEYPKLRKMQPIEIIKYLGETDYKEEIHKEAIDFREMSILDGAMAHNFARTVHKLNRIADKEIKQILAVFLLRRDIWSIKTLLRAKQAGRQPSEIKELMLIAGNYPPEWYERLTKLSIPEILKQIPFSDSLPKAYADTKSLTTVENQLDYYYLGMLAKSARRAPSQRLKSFILQTIDCYTIQNIFKAKISGSKDMDQYTMPGLKLNSSIIKRMCSAKTVKDLADIVKETSYGTVLKAGLAVAVADNSSSKLEEEFNAYLLKQGAGLAHSPAMSAEQITSFLFLKEIEAHNLGVIIKALHWGMSPEFIDSKLVSA